GNTFTYSLVAGTGSTDNAAFNISGSSLRITASPDFETKNSYSIRIRTTDQGGLSFEKAVTITVNDVCELVDTVTRSSGVLTADQPGATYQWIQCPATILIGENGQSFTPTAVGSYAVVVTIGTCSVISTCINVTTLGNPDFEQKSKFAIYPNPSKGTINIESDSNGDFQIINQLGQTVKMFNAKANVVNSINVETLTDGIYFVKDSNKNKSYKLIIKK
ncbi:secretion protein, partial [Flavobacterium alvei]